MSRFADCDSSTKLLRRSISSSTLTKIPRSTMIPIHLNAVVDGTPLARHSEVTETRSFRPEAAAKSRIMSQAGSANRSSPKILPRFVRARAISRRKSGGGKPGLLWRVENSWFINVMAGRSTLDELLEFSIKFNSKDSICPSLPSRPLDVVSTMEMDSILIDSDVSGPVRVSSPARCTQPVKGCPPNHTQKDQQEWNLIECPIRNSHTIWIKQRRKVSADRQQGCSCSKNRPIPVRFQGNRHEDHYKA